MGDRIQETMNGYRYNSTFKSNRGFKSKAKGLSRKYGLKRTTRIKPGRKTKEWNAERRRLKVKHGRAGITTCELRNNPEVPHLCSCDDFLGFAHDAKRRKLSKEDLGRAILVCNNSHDSLERMPPAKMKRIVNETIARRAA